MSRAKYKNRVIGLETHVASELVSNPHNWRKHPDNQLKVLASSMKAVGMSTAVIAYRDPEWGLVLIDGHARCEVAKDESVPVLVLDVTRAEADALLATMDPIAAMASQDDAALASLLEADAAESAAIRRLLDDVHHISSDPFDSLIGDSGEEYVPILTPTIATSAVQPDDIVAAQVTHDVQFTDHRRPDMVTMICPHCAETFEVKKSG